MHEDLDLGALSETEDDLCSKDYDAMNLNLMRTTSKCQDDSEINASPAPQHIGSPNKRFSFKRQSLRNLMRISSIDLKQHQSPAKFINKIPEEIISDEETDAET